MGAVTAVAVSGGVDSALAAALLQEAGEPVVGLTARLTPESSHAPRACCDEQRARELCAALGLEHYVVDLGPEFEAQVVGPFVAAYGAGLTPNPCLPCNRLIKFGGLWERAQALGCHALATGHFALRAPRHGRWALRRGADLAKDQSYMLLELSQAQLEAARFPLGEVTKAQVRAEAQRRRLPFSERESQDVCFVPAGVAEFLSARLQAPPGPILDPAGARLGTHRGLPFYTVGQRRGLGVGGEARLFVLAKDPARNALLVGPREGLCRREFPVRQVNWVSLPPPAPGSVIPCQVMLRYRGALVAGSVAVSGERDCAVELAPHDQAVAPGQGAAFYDEGGWLLGGGVISEV